MKRAAALVAACFFVYGSGGYGSAAQTLLAAGGPIDDARLPGDALHVFALPKM